jgi:hypothetical protein
MTYLRNVQVKLRNYMTYVHLQQDDCYIFFKMIYGINKVIIDLTTGTLKDRPGCPINIILLTTFFQKNNSEISTELFQIRNEQDDIFKIFSSF